MDRRKSGLLIVTVLLVMLFGMAASMVAQQETPETSTDDLEATIAALQTQAATQRRAEASATAQANETLLATARANQPDPDVRLTKDGQPMTEEQIAHDDKLWHELDPYFDGLDGSFYNVACVPGRVSQTVSSALAEGKPLEKAWRAAYQAGYLTFDYSEWYQRTIPIYQAAEDQAYGVPPSWVPVDLLLSNYAIARMDPKYPGCSTGTYEPDAAATPGA